MACLTDRDGRQVLLVWRPACYAYRRVHSLDLQISRLTETEPDGNARRLVDGRWKWGIIFPRRDGIVTWRRDVVGRWRHVVAGRGVENRGCRGWSIGLPRPLMPLVLTPALLAPLMFPPACCRRPPSFSCACAGAHAAMTLRASNAAIAAVITRMIVSWR